MDNILEMAKELGYALQQDDRFIRIQLAQAAADEDEGLQGLIGEFNLKRIALNTEMTKSEQEKDEEKIKRLNTELREVYTQLMANDHMAAYQKAKEELDTLVRQIGTIITLSAQGQDPDEEPSSCSGNCSGCSGCH